MTTKSTAELTLRDRLSRLTYTQVCKLLGEEGEKLIRAGGTFEIDDMNRQVFLGEDLFRLNLPGAIATITLMAERRQRLHFNCTACHGVCEHIGAAFSLILEEKTALGLAAPPPERAPVESLSEEELVRQALAEREERARSEKMTLRSMDPKTMWTDYVVTSAASGKTYRVALRGWEHGESYCSCPDFRKNTLGTCKHILHALAKVRKRFLAAVRNRPYRRRQIEVHLIHGDELELRLLLPEKPDKKVQSIAGALAKRPVTDMHDLLGRIRKLEAAGHDVTIYPDAEEFIQHRLFQDRIETTVAAIRRDPAKHPLRKSLLKTELLPYQLDGIAFAVGAGRAILADDMGLGKTIQGIGVAELLAREVDIRKVLVVCPASVKSQWFDEIRKFADRSARIVLGSAEERARQYGEDCFFTICNYEQVLRDFLPIERAHWDLIVLDEGQRIKNWEAKTSQVIKSLSSPFALVLSGTPMENRLGELYSVVGFIDDRRLGPAFRFFNRHRVADEKGKILGYRNLDRLRETLKPVLLRRTRASVMRQLPPRTTEVLRIAPSDEQLSLHRAHMQIVSQIVGKKFITEMDLLRLRKALLMCRMAADSTFLIEKQEPSYSTKLAELDELLDRLCAEEDRKIVLFSEWTTMLDLIETLLKKRKLKYVRLDGSVPQKKRSALMHEFQENPDCTLFIATNAGATGLNLQKANTVINVDLPWNPAVLEQRIARAHRMGQKRPVQVYILVTEGTIEENLLATLSAKHELAAAALDVDSEIDSVDFESSMEELKRRLEVLLGAKPEAETDLSQKAAREAEAAALARRERVAAAGGQLLSAAFQFLGEMLPAPQPSDAARRQADEIKQGLAECLEKTEDGRLELTVSLPGPEALDTLSDALARMLGSGKTDA